MWETNKQANKQIKTKQISKPNQNPKAIGRIPRIGYGFQTAIPFNFKTECSHKQSNFFYFLIP